MTTDPNRTRNLTLVVAAGLAIAVGAMAWLIANADTLRAAAGS